MVATHTKALLRTSTTALMVSMPRALTCWLCPALKKIRLTGAGESIVPSLDRLAAEALIDDGRGWDNKDRNSAYDKLTVDQLVERLGSWSPIVRERAAMALGRRKEVPIPAIIKLLDASNLDTRYGACQALSILGPRAATAVDSLQRRLDDNDLWLRVRAADALAKIGRQPNLQFQSCWNCWRRWTRPKTLAACNSVTLHLPCSMVTECSVGLSRVSTARLCTTRCELA